MCKIKNKIVDAVFVRRTYSQRRRHNIIIYVLCVHTYGYNHRIEIKCSELLKLRRVTESKLVNIYQTHVCVCIYYISVPRLCLHTGVEGNYWKRSMRKNLYGYLFKVQTNFCFELHLRVAFIICHIMVITFSFGFDRSWRITVPSYALPYEHVNTLKTKTYLRRRYIQKKIKTK